MGRRPDGRKNTINFNFRLDSDELAEARALAQYLGVELSRLIRDLLKEKRRQLVAEGKRPPLRPRES